MGWGLGTAGESDLRVLDRPYLDWRVVVGLGEGGRLGGRLVGGVVWEEAQVQL